MIFIYANAQFYYNSLFCFLFPALFFFGVYNIISVTKS